MYIFLFIYDNFNICALQSFCCERQKCQKLYPMFSKREVCSLPEWVVHN